MLGKRDERYLKLQFSGIENLVDTGKMREKRGMKDTPRCLLCKHPKEEIHKKVQPRDRQKCISAVFRNRHVKFIFVFENCS